MPTAPEPCDLLVDGGLVLTLDAGDRILADGAVAILADRIVAVEPAPIARARFAPLVRIDARRRIVMPGLVNTHNHTPLVITRGMVEDMNFAPMYTARVPQGYRLGAEEVYLLSRLGAWDLLRTGSTTVVDYYRHGDSCATERDILDDGIRAFFHDVAPARLRGISDADGDDTSFGGALRRFEEQRTAHDGAGGLAGGANAHHAGHELARPAYLVEIGEPQVVRSRVLPVAQHDPMAVSGKGAERTPVVSQILCRR